MTFIPVITGVGLATPLGMCSGSNFAALREGRYIRAHSAIPDFHARPRLAELATRVATEAYARAELSHDDPEPTALVIATSKGSVIGWLSPPEPPSADHSTPSIPSFGLSDLAAHLAGRLRLEGPRLTLSAACASGLHAVIRAALLVRSGEVRRALVVGAESSVHPLFLGSFRRLGVLAPEGEMCRPFDSARSGFLMSEAAAAVVIEAVEPEEPVAGRIGARALAQVEHFALGGDATHLTGGDSGACVLRRLLTRVLDGCPLDLVHAHGTGTMINDATELAAIESVIAPGDSVASLYSHKGALGHSLGAAGVVSIVLNCLSHRHGIILPNVTTQTPMPTRRVSLSLEARNCPVQRSLAIAAGFGGAVAAVSLLSPRLQLLSGC